jgi:hypothetical protein
MCFSETTPHIYILLLLLIVLVFAYEVIAACAARSKLQRLLSQSYCIRGRFPCRQTCLHGIYYPSIRLRDEALDVIRILRGNLRELWGDGALVPVGARL